MIELLTLQGDRGATLTELAKHVGQTPSALVHVLATLTDAGFVTRRPSDRRYHVGPALISPGDVARSRAPHLGRTRDVVSRLAERTGHCILAFQREGDHARLVEAGWDAAGVAPWMRIGDVLPIAPPLGASFIAWNGEAEIKKWLARVPNARTKDALRRRVVLAQQRGFVVELRPHVQLADELLRLKARGQNVRSAEGLSGAMAGLEQYIAEEIRPSVRYPLAAIAAPVCEPGGVKLTIGVASFDTLLTGRQVLSFGRLVRAHADQIAEK